MRSGTDHLSIGAARANALFASALQRSAEPGTDQVRDAVAAAVREYGSRGCAARVAQEFGDHPETAVARMRWARAMTSAAFAGPAPRQDHASPSAGGTGYQGVQAA